MGSKNLELLNSYKVRFCEYAIAKYDDIDIARANELWEQIESFARYGFNKSHSLAYSLVGYICQYLRQHYPLEWYCSVFSNGSKDDRKKMYPNIRNMVELPSLNKSKSNFYIKDNKIITSLSFINGMGDRSVEECTSKAPFISFEDFFERVNKRIVRRDIIAALIFAGCFRDVDQRSKVELIELLYKLNKAEYPEEFKNLTSLRIAELEVEYLPIQDMDYASIFKDIIPEKTSDIRDIERMLTDSRASVVGKVSKVLKKKTAKGHEMAFFDLNNGGDKVRVLVCPDKMGEASKILKNDAVIYITGKVNRWKSSTSLIFDKGRIL